MCISDISWQEIIHKFERAWDGIPNFHFISIWDNLSTHFNPLYLLNWYIAYFVVLSNELWVLKLRMNSSWLTWNMNYKPIMTIQLRSFTWNMHYKTIMTIQVRSYKRRTIIFGKETITVLIEMCSSSHGAGLSKLS